MVASHSVEESNTQISGELSDMGRLDSGLGIRVATENGAIEILGMTTSQVKSVAHLLGEKVTITIAIAGQA